MINKIKAGIYIAFSYFLILGQTIAYAQSTAAILPQGKTQFFDNNGNPLTSGKVFFYIPSTTTAKTTWEDSSKSVANTNPVILDSGGRAVIYGDGTYRQIVRDRNNNIIYDAVTASAGTGGGTTGTGDGDLVGTIKPWAGLVAPNQYAFAYGQEVSRTTYATLFTAVTLQQTITCVLGNPTAINFSDTSQIPVGAVIESLCFAAGTTVVSKTSTTVTFNNNSSLSTVDTIRIFLYGNGNGSSTFNLPDLRGYVIAGRQNMGGTAATRLPTTYNASGAASGASTATLITPNLPAYTPAGTISQITPAGTISQITPAGTVSNSASGTSTYTPAGTPTAAGTITNSGSGTSTYTPEGSVINAGSGTSTYTPEGTNTTPTVNVTNGTSLIQIGGVTANATFGGGGGTSVNVTAALSGAPLFSGTARVFSFGGTARTFAFNNSGSTFAGTPVTLSFAGTPTTPTFTGTPVTPTFTGTAQGGVSTAFSIVQPTQSLNYIIKITPDSNSADASGVTSLGGMIGDIACGTGLLCTGNIISITPVVTSLGGLTGALTCGSGLSCVGSTVSVTGSVPRIKLTTNTTYFVATTGNNNNTCLTALDPCLTIQGAWDKIVYGIDAQGFIVTISVADGTYTTALGGLGTPIGIASATAGLRIIGNQSNPQNVKINTVASAFNFNQEIGGVPQVYISGFELNSTAGSGIAASNGGTMVLFDTIRFGTCLTAHIETHTGAYVQATGNYAVIGGTCTAHVTAQSNSVVVLRDHTITYSNSPVFSINMIAGGGKLYVANMIFNNFITVTGTRFAVTDNGSIVTGQSLLTYIPGSVDGTESTGGIIDSGSVWPPYSPGTPSCFSGSGTLSSTGQVISEGTKYRVHIQLTVTTIGTCSGFVDLALPAAVVAGSDYVLRCIDTNSNKTYTARLPATGSIARIYLYDGTFTANDGSIISCDGDYQRG